MLRVIGQVFPWDLADGAERAASWKNLGIDEVAIALYYHAVRAVRWRGDGSPAVVTQNTSALYLPIDDKVWSRQPLAPAPPTIGPSGSGLDAVEVALASGLTPKAWLALTHRDQMSRDDARFAVVDVWGNRSAYSLCPSHPEVQAFGCELLRQVHETTGITDFLLESVASHGAEHSVAHDKLPFAWADDPWMDTLSLCFCHSCHSAGYRLGVDLTAVSTDIRSRLKSGPVGSGLDEPLEIARNLRRRIANEFLHNLTEVASEIGARITVAATTDERSYGSYAPLELTAGTAVTGCAQLSADGGRGWDDVGEWLRNGTQAVAGVVDMLPPATSLMGALTGPSGNASPIHLLDEIYLYHLGLRRPSSLDGLRISEAIDHHRSTKGQQ